MMVKRECRAVARILWDYAQLHLGESDADRVEIHIARCAKCRRELQAYRITAGLVRSCRQEPEPESRITWHALRTQIEHAQKSQPVDVPTPTRRASAIPVWAGTVVAGAVLAAVWTSFRPSEAKPDSSDLIALKGQYNMPLISAPPEVDVSPIADSNTGEPRDDAESTGPRIQDAGFRPDPPVEQIKVAESAPSHLESIQLQPVERFRVKTAATQRSSAKRNSRNASEDQIDSAPAPESIRPEPRREFVMGTIPSSGSRITPVSNRSGDSPQEPPVW